MSLEAQNAKKNKSKFEIDIDISVHTQHKDTFLSTKPSKVNIIDFKTHPKDIEYYKNSFTKFYNDIIGMKSKIKQAFMDQKSLRTSKTIVSENIFDSMNDISIAESNTSDNIMVVKVNSVYIKSVTSLVFEAKIENLYEKEKKRNSGRKSIENCLLNSKYYHDESGYRHLMVSFRTEGFNLLYLNIDLLLKLIAFEEFHYFSYDVSQFLIYQFYVFIRMDIFFDKIKNLFDYYAKKKAFPRGIIVFLHRLVESNLGSEVMTLENLISIKKFLVDICRYPEAAEIDFKIRESIGSATYQMKLLLTNQTLGTYFKFTEEFKKAKNPIIPEKPPKYFDIIEWSEIEIARQITLATQYIFMQIQSTELVSSNWVKVEKYALAPNIMKMIDRFNLLTNWINEEILSYDKKTNRAKAITKFIKIASVLRSFNNFNDCINIVAALNTTPIKSLKNTWQVVLKNQETDNLLKSLNTLCSYSKNYHNIRAETSSTIKGQPCIPYLGLYLRELAFLDEGPKYIDEKNLVNLDKLYRVGEKLIEIKEYQSIPYVFLPVKRLAFLAEPQPKSEEVLLQISSKLEPKYLLNSSKSIKKRPTMTDLTSHELNETFKEMCREFSQELLIDV